MIIQESRQRRWTDSTFLLVFVLGTTWATDCWLGRHFFDVDKLIHGLFLAFMIFCLRWKWPRMVELRPKTLVLNLGRFDQYLFPLDRLERLSILRNRSGKVSAFRCRQQDFRGSMTITGYPEMAAIAEHLKACAAATVTERVLWIDPYRPLTYWLALGAGIALNLVGLYLRGG